MIFSMNGGGVMFAEVGQLLLRQREQITLRGLSTNPCGIVLSALLLE